MPAHLAVRVGVEVGIQVADSPLVIFQEFVTVDHVVQGGVIFRVCLKAFHEAGLGLAVIVQEEVFHSQQGIDVYIVFAQGQGLAQKVNGSGVVVLLGVDIGALDEDLLILRVELLELVEQGLCPVKLVFEHEYLHVEQAELQGVRVLLQAHADGFLGQGDLAVVQVVVNDFLKIFGVEEVDVVGLEHGFKFPYGFVRLFARIVLHKCLFAFRTILKVFFLRGQMPPGVGFLINKLVNRSPRIAVEDLQNQGATLPDFGL